MKVGDRVKLIRHNPINKAFEPELGSTGTIIATNKPTIKVLWDTDTKTNDKEGYSITTRLKRPWWISVGNVEVIETPVTNNEARVEKIETAYSDDRDMTFILKDTRNEDGVLLSTEVIGFYFGRPDEKLTEKYSYDLKATF